MSKAKLILTAVGVLAIVGGALAFKAQRFGNGNVFYVTTLPNNVTICTLNETLATTNQVSPLSLVFTTRNSSGVCGGQINTFTIQVEE